MEYCKKHFLSFILTSKEKRNEPKRGRNAIYFRGHYEHICWFPKILLEYIKHKTTILSKFNVANFRWLSTIIKLDVLGVKSVKFIID